MGVPIMEKNHRQLPTHCHRIVLYGPESTGKTTLAKALAAHYDTEWVPEFARTYLQEKWDSHKTTCTLEDLPLIVHGQLAWENERLAKAKRWLFCDTNALVTQVWSVTHFNGYCAPEIKAAVHQLHYDFYLLTTPDIPWEKDDLRDRPEARDAMFGVFKQYLESQNTPYFVVTGQGEQRLQSAIQALERAFPLAQ